MWLLQPLHQRQVVGVAAEQRHRRVRVAVDEAGHDRRAGAVDHLVAGARPSTSGPELGDRAVLDPQADRARRRASRPSIAIAIRPPPSQSSAPTASTRRRQPRAVLRLAGLELLDRERLGRRPRWRGCRRRRRRRRGCPSSPARMHSEATSCRSRRRAAAISRISAGRLEARPDRLPVDAAVDQLGLGDLGPRSSRTRAPPAGVEAGDALAAVLIGEREAEVEGDEVVGAEEGADAELGPQAADRGDREDPVAAELGAAPRSCARGRSWRRSCSARSRGAGAGPARRARGRRPGPGRSRRSRGSNPAPGSAPRIECPPISASRPID